MKSCCFIGHRNAKLSVEEVNYLKTIIINLINCGVVRFLFGSKSKFNDSCFDIVEKLQETYKQIELVGYCCNSEHFCLKNEKEIENAASKIIGKTIKIKFYDKVVDKNCSGKGAYVLRNQKMIDDCDICVFYYDLNYNPTNFKSGTRLAFDYAIRKNKKIFNIKL